VIVVDVLRVRLVADRADAALVANQVVELVDADAVAPLQVIVTIAAVQPILRLAPTSVMAWLAIRMPPVTHPLVPRKFFEGFVLAAVRTALHAPIVRTGYDNDLRKHCANH
jgi:hypothetical protein